MNYQEFLKSKMLKIQDSGFEVKESDLNENLFDFQKFIVKKALQKGRYAVFADTGTGKTIMQLEFANQVFKKEKKSVLILCPLAVEGQTINEGKKFGIKVERLKENKEVKNGIYIINYEQIKNIENINDFIGIVLDESSLLKNFTGKYKNLIINTFKNTKYKLCCTATPSPNDINEIGNHSEFLNIMDAPDMRSRWFVRDEGMNNYRLKGHAEAEFYGWISSWATMIQNPCDIGFNETGKKFILPKLIIETIKIKTEKQDNGMLFNFDSVNATDFYRELRRCVKERISALENIILKHKNESIIVWVNTNQEADLVKDKIKEMGITFAEVRGNEDREIKENKLLGFGKGEFDILITKKKIAQFGLNYQNCHIQIFLGLDFSFESFYQSIRRSYRFGQKKDVVIYTITTDTMQNVVNVIKHKELEFKKLRDSVNKYINNKEYKTMLDYNKREVKNEYYHIINGDSVVEIDNIPDNSIDFSVFSPPFSNLFIYSNSYRDMGNSQDNEEFFKQTDFLLSKLFKKIRPGRLVAVHTKDLAVYKNADGHTGLYDFTGDYHRAMEKAGFKYHSKITIWTDPVLEMQRTKTQRLLYKQLRKDSTYTGVGLPEYLTLFRKWEGIDNKESVKAVNNKNFENFNLDTWQKWASPVWGEKLSKEELIEIINTYSERNGIINFESLKELPTDSFGGTWFDIKRTDVLNKKEGSENKDEKHICPLQLTVIRRAIQMWSNKGEVVFTPFLGIGSELYEAIKCGRKGIGIELKEKYFDIAKKNLNYIVAKNNTPMLFDL